MRAKTMIAVAVAALLLLGGVAMVGAATPADQADDNAMDADEEHGPEDDDERAGPPADVGPSDQPDDVGPSDQPDDVGPSDERADNASSVGPSDGLPEQVPDHVSSIHETIESFLNGVIDNLGEALSELLSDGDAADGGDGNATDGGDGNATDGGPADEASDTGQPSV